MELTELYRTDGEDAVVLNVHVQPGAGRTAVVGRHGTALKVRVAAPPQGGRANEACAALLVDTFGGKAELVSGGSSRQKRFRLTELDLEEFPRRLERVVQEGAGETGPDVRQTGRH